MKLYSTSAWPHSSFDKRCVFGEIPSGFFKGAGGRVSAAGWSEHS